MTLSGTSLHISFTFFKSKTYGTLLHLRRKFFEFHPTNPD